MNPTDRKTAIALVVIAVLAVPLIYALKDVEGPKDVSPITKLTPPAGYHPPAPGANGTSVQTPAANAIPAAPQKLEIDVTAPPSVPSYIVDVYEPAKLHGAIKQNAWLQDALQQPLGQGFVGPWAGFWGTKGEDVAASFKGQVIDYVASQLLDAPSRIVWFSGSQATSTPVVLVPQPGAGAQAAFEALTKAAGHGVQLAEACPGDAPAPTDGGAPPVTRHFEIQRWVLANQAMYASLGPSGLAIAKNPTAVLQGLCAKIPAATRTPGADLELTIATPGLGHDAVVLTSLMGLGPQPRLAFGVEGDKLVPRGIAGELATPGRVDVAALSDDLLKAIPVDAPVLLTAQLKLPKTLDPETLKTFFAGKSNAPTVTRQVAIVWVPHGDAKANTDVALLWSKKEDAESLKQAFSGNNTMRTGTICNQLVYASSGALLDRIQRTCDGKQPALANSAAPVVAGLRQPQSVGLSIQLGALLSGVTLDAWNAESQAAGRAPAVPKEIDAARQKLEELPTFGLTGTAQGNALVAGGFHS
ncbi:MAG: hypothetical protein JST54_09805 [Deltaproteobacteria bacterium]|nr:hypothetical protein [Deltaproteobacteria bacterium]